MTRHLWLIRHAKTANPPATSDFDRPLAARGRDDAALMVAWLRRQSHPATLVVSSPALRAMQTAQYVARAFGLDESAILEDPDLYLASPETILATIRAQPDAFRSLAVVGHNPGFGQLVNLLAGHSVADNLPTFGTALFEVAVSWSEVSASSAAFRVLMTPKRLR